MTTGALSHIDISMGYPDRSIPFYETLLSGLGYKRMSINHAGFTGEKPQRAWWSMDYLGGVRFGIEVRPAAKEKRNRRYDRYEPGPHHMAFHASSTQQVDAIYQAMFEADAEILDPPTDYSEQSGYSKGYYAVCVHSRQLLTFWCRSDRMGA